MNLQRVDESEFLLYLTSRDVGAFISVPSKVFCDIGSAGILIESGSSYQ